MIQKTLKNSLKIIYDKKKSNSITILVNTDVGSNFEPKSIAGISHFLEHMFFEGSKNRTVRQIGESIENVGGEFNAATSHERTIFYIKVPKKHFKLAVDILSDILKNPLFDPKILDKERKVVLEEIKMIYDQPLHYQWTLFLKTLFKRHPTKNSIAGSAESVKNITRTQMFNYFKKFINLFT